MDQPLTDLDIAEATDQDVTLRKVPYFTFTDGQTELQTSSYSHVDDGC